MKTGIFEITKPQKRIVRDVSEVLIKVLTNVYDRLDSHPFLMAHDLDREDMDGTISDLALELRDITENPNIVLQLSKVDLEIFIDTMNYLSHLFEDRSPKAFNNLKATLEMRLTMFL